MGQTPPTLRSGSRGAEVSELQQLLTHRGYPAAADGIFGPETSDATRWFQHDYGMVVDAVVGPATWRGLRDRHLPPQPLPPAGTLRQGSLYSKVRRLQAQLNEAGASPALPVDGEFGRGTTRAVRDYQRKHGLKADGVVGPLTWGALFEGVEPPGTPPEHLLEGGEQPEPAPAAPPATEPPAPEPAAPAPEPAAPAAPPSSGGSSGEVLEPSPTGAVEVGVGETTGSRAAIPVIINKTATVRVRGARPLNAVELPVRPLAGGGDEQVILGTAAGTWDEPAWEPCHPKNFKRGGPERSIDRIVIHITDGVVAGAIATFKSEAARVSAHYVVDRTGGVTQMVQDADYAFHATVFNERSIGIENEGWVTEDTWTEVQYVTLAALVRRLCARHGLPQDREHIVGHTEVPGVTKSCPGPQFDWERFIGLVRSERVPEPPAPGGSSFVGFLPGGSVLLPSGLDAVSGAFEVVRQVPDHLLLVAGHGADEALSQARAEGVLALLRDPEAWAGLAAERARAEDRDAVRRALGLGGSGDLDWADVARRYDARLRELSPDPAPLRGSVRTTEPGAVGCGGAWPLSKIRIAAWRGTQDERVDLLWFEEADAPKLKCHAGASCDWKKCDVYRKKRYKAATHVSLAPEEAAGPAPLPPLPPEELDPSATPPTLVRFQGVAEVPPLLNEPRKEEPLPFRAEARTWFAGGKGEIPRQPPAELVVLHIGWPTEVILSWKVEGELTRLVLEGAGGQQLLIPSTELEGEHTVDAEALPPDDGTWRLIASNRGQTATRELTVVGIRRFTVESQEPGEHPLQAITNHLHKTGPYVDKLHGRTGTYKYSHQRARASQRIGPRPYWTYPERLAELKGRYYGVILHTTQPKVRHAWEVIGAGKVRTEFEMSWIGADSYDVSERTRAGGGDGEARTDYQVKSAQFLDADLRLYEDLDGVKGKELTTALLRLWIHRELPELHEFTLFDAGGPMANGATISGPWEGLRVSWSLTGDVFNNRIFIRVLDVQTGAQLGETMVKGMRDPNRAPTAPVPLDLPHPGGPRDVTVQCRMINVEDELSRVPSKALRELRVTIPAVGAAPITPANRCPLGGACPYEKARAARREFIEAMRAAESVIEAKSHRHEIANFVREAAYQMAADPKNDLDAVEVWSSLRPKPGGRETREFYEDTELSVEIEQLQASLDGARDEADFKARLLINAIADAEAHLVETSVHSELDAEGVSDLHRWLSVLIEGIGATPNGRGMLAELYDPDPTLHPGYGALWNLVEQEPWSAAQELVVNRYLLELTTLVQHRAQQVAMNGGDPTEDPEVLRYLEIIEKRTKSPDMTKDLVATSKNLGKEIGGRVLRAMSATATRRSEKLLSVLEEIEVDQTHSRVGRLAAGGVAVGLVVDKLALALSISAASNVFKQAGTADLIGLAGGVVGVTNETAKFVGRAHLAVEGAPPGALDKLVKYGGRVAAVAGAVAAAIQFHDAWKDDDGRKMVISGVAVAGAAVALGAELLASSAVAGIIGIVVAVLVVAITYALSEHPLIAWLNRCPWGNRNELKLDQVYDKYFSAFFSLALYWNQTGDFLEVRFNKDDQDVFDLTLEVLDGGPKTKQTKTIQLTERRLDGRRTSPTGNDYVERVSATKFYVYRLREAFGLRFDAEYEVKLTLAYEVGGGTVKTELETTIEPGQGPKLVPFESGFANWFANLQRRGALVTQDGDRFIDYDKAGRDIVVSPGTIDAKGCRVRIRVVEEGGLFDDDTVLSAEAAEVTSHKRTDTAVDARLRKPKDAEDAYEVRVEAVLELNGTELERLEHPFVYTVARRAFIDAQ